MIQSAVFVLVPNRSVGTPVGNILCLISIATWWYSCYITIKLSHIHIKRLLKRKEKQEEPKYIELEEGQ